MAVWMTFSSYRTRDLTRQSFRDVSAVAILTRSGSWSIEENFVPIDFLLERMTCRTSHFFMTTFQWKFCLVMIEERRAPLVAVVASCAIVRAIAELSGMWVFVAFCASFRRTCELDVHQIQLHIRGLVAVRTCHCAMRSNERELGLGVVEF